MSKYSDFVFLELLNIIERKEGGNFLPPSKYLKPNHKYAIKLVIYKIMAEKTTEEILSQVQEITNDKMGIDKEDVKMESKINDDLGLDSLDTVELIMEIERHFNIAIPDDNAENFYKVSDVVNYLYENLPGQKEA